MVLRSDPSYLYPEELADEGMGDKTKSIYPLVFADEGMGDKTKSIYPLVYADEGMGDKTKSIYPLVFAGEGIGGKTRLIIPADLRGRGYRRQNQADYTYWLSNQRGIARDFVGISPGDLGASGHSKRFCQDKPRGYSDIGA